MYTYINIFIGGNFNYGRDPGWRIPMRPIFNPQPTTIAPNATFAPNPSNCSYRFSYICFVGICNYLNKRLIEQLAQIDLFKSHHATLWVRLDSKIAKSKACQI